MTSLLKYCGTESKIDTIAAGQTAKEMQLASLSGVRSFLITIGVGVKFTLTIEQHIL
jgi:hypothetical protein